MVGERCTFLDISYIQPDTSIGLLWVTIFHMWPRFRMSFGSTVDYTLHGRLSPAREKL